MYMYPAQARACTNAPSSPVVNTNAAANSIGLIALPLSHRAPRELRCSTPSTISSARIAGSGGGRSKSSSRINGCAIPTNLFNNMGSIPYTGKYNCVAKNDPQRFENAGVIDKFRMI
jgi:hypothetical protein